MLGPQQQHTCTSLATQFPPSTLVKHYRCYARIQYWTRTRNTPTEASSHSGSKQQPVVARVRVHLFRQGMVHLFQVPKLVRSTTGGFDQRRMPSRFRMLLLLFLTLPLSAGFRLPCFSRSCGSTICTVLCFFAAIDCVKLGGQDSSFARLGS